MKSAKKLAYLGMTAAILTGAAFTASAAEPVAKEDLKVGIIYLRSYAGYRRDERSSRTGR